MCNAATETVEPVSLYRPAGIGRVERAMGTAHIYKVRSAETGGRFSCFEALIPPGAMVPPHRHHDEDEAFYCLEGEIVMELEGMQEPVRMRQGDFCFSPRGRRHTFRNEGTVAARALAIVTPGNRTEQMFSALQAAIVQSRGVAPVARAA